MCGIDVRKRAFGPQTSKTTLWVNLSEFGFFFYHVVCGVQVTLKLNFNAM